MNRRRFLVAGMRLVGCGALLCCGACRGRDAPPAWEDTLRVFGVDLVGYDPVGEHGPAVSRTAALIVHEALADPTTAPHYKACAARLDALSRERGLPSYGTAEPAERASVLEAYSAEVRNEQIRRIGPVRARPGEYVIRLLLKRFYSSDAGWSVVGDAA